MRDLEYLYDLLLLIDLAAAQLQRSREIVLAERNALAPDDAETIRQLRDELDQWGEES